jgi:hypothetical protein
MSVSAVTMRVSAPSVDSRSGTTGQMPTDALLLPPCATPPQRFPSQVHPTASTKTVRRMRLDCCWIRFHRACCWTPRPGSGTQPGSPHSFHENRPPDAPRPLLDPLPRGCLLDPALALAPSQVHPTASTKTVRRMRLDCCWIRFHRACCWTPRPGSGTQPGSPHSFHENRPPDAPRPLLDPLPRGCCWTTPPWLWHPARFTPQLPRKPSAGCASTVAGSASPWLFAGPRPGSGTQPGSPHSFHENRPPDAPRLLRHALPRGCCWTTPPWLWHPARFTPQLPRKPSAGCASTVAGSASTVRVAGPPALALAPSQVHPTASTKTVRRMRLDC